MSVRRTLGLAALLFGSVPASAKQVALAAPAAAPRNDRWILSVVGTNDLHGHVEQLPILGGYLHNLRESLNEGHRGELVLLDGGDLFQGTIESNASEGEAVVAAYNLLGYDASAIGNHEFDFGPVGEARPWRKTDDPRGALKARALQAKFPFLSANLVDTVTGKQVGWPHLPGSVILDRRGLSIGVIGLSTVDTPTTTMESNFIGLRIAPLAETVITEAKSLRARGAKLIFVVAHAGGDCKNVEDPNDLSSCHPDEEIFKLARALPIGTVDLIVGGHTHAGVAHEVFGIPIIESYDHARAFGRVDFTIEQLADGGRAVAHHIFPPKRMCNLDSPCDYQGHPVKKDSTVETLMAPYIKQAEARRAAPLGVKVVGRVARSYKEESPLGNLIADLMRAARPGADVAIMNGGGLRAELPAGPLTYGEMYEIYPFDNAFATLKVPARAFAAWLARNLTMDAGIISLSGLRASAGCEGGQPHVTLTRESGKRVGDDEILKVLSSDFLATGAEGLSQQAGAPYRVEKDSLVRETLVDFLKKRGGAIDPNDRTLFDAAHKRFSYPGKRPLRCGEVPAKE